MRPRSDGLKYASQADISPRLCLSCGICVGSCPTATPFRTRSALSPGIDLPDQKVAEIRELVTEAASGLHGSRRLLVFGCEGRSDLTEIQDSETAIVYLTCMAQLPPSFIDFVLSRNLADGVALAGCDGGDCQYRLGAAWTEQRIKRERDPHLRKRVDTTKLAVLWTEPWRASRNLVAALNSFRGTISFTAKSERPAKRRGKFFRTAGIAMAWALFAVSAGIFSMWPPFNQLEAGNAIISLTFSHAGERIEECKKLSQEELNKLPPNMRKPVDCPRERHPVRISFIVDDVQMYNQTLHPSGFWKDGESTVYKRFELPAGSHDLFIGMNDSGASTGFDFEGRTAIILSEGQHLLVEFDHRHKSFIFR